MYYISIVIFCMFSVPVEYSQPCPVDHIFYKGACLAKSKTQQLIHEAKHTCARKNLNSYQSI